MPWPCSNRDVIYQIKQTNKLDEFKVILDIKSVQNDSLLSKDFIRAYIYKSQIILSSEENNNGTVISTETFFDPRGSIPKWIVNLFQRKQSLKLARGLIKELKLKRKIQ